MRKNGNTSVFLVPRPCKAHSEAIWIADMGSSEEPTGSKDAARKSDALVKDPVAGHPAVPGFWHSWSTWNVTAADWDILLVSTVIKLLLYPS